MEASAPWSDPVRRGCDQSERSRSRCLVWLVLARANWVASQRTHCQIKCRSVEMKSGKMRLVIWTHSAAGGKWNYVTHCMHVALRTPDCRRTTVKCLGSWHDWRQHWRHLTSSSTCHVDDDQPCRAAEVCQRGHVTSNVRFERQGYISGL